jgi:hypothetical protein
MEEIKTLLSSYWTWLTVCAGFIAGVWWWKMTANTANFSLAISVAALAFAVSRQPWIAGQPLLVRLLWIVAFCTVLSLVLYYTLWTPFPGKDMVIPWEVSQRIPTDRKLRPLVVGPDPKWPQEKKKTWLYIQAWPDIGMPSEAVITIWNRGSELDRDIYVRMALPPTGGITIDDPQRVHVRKQSGGLEIWAPELSPNEHHIIKVKILSAGDGTWMANLWSERYGDSENVFMIKGITVGPMVPVTPQP